MPFSCPFLFAHPFRLRRRWWSWGVQQAHLHVLETSRRVLGKDHPRTLFGMHYLALTLWSQGDFGGACELLERVIEAQRRMLGDDHPDTLASMGNLALTLIWNDPLSSPHRALSR